MSMLKRAERLLVWCLLRGSDMPGYHTGLAYIRRALDAAKDGGAAPHEVRTLRIWYNYLTR